MQAKADEKGVDLILLDTGDRIEGNGLSDASNPKGMFTREIFKTLNLDLVTTGNHELYKAASSNGEWDQMLPHYGNKYVTSNVEIYVPETGELKPLGKKFRKFTTKNKGYRIKAFGFLFDFKGNYNNTVVTTVEDEMKKEWFQREIRDPEIDLFLVFGHAPVRGSPEFPNIHRVIREANPTVPIQFFGGHTHIRDFAVYDKASTALESGRYCETVGWLSISGMPAPGSALPPTDISFSRRYIDFNRFGFQHHSNTSAVTFDTREGKQISVMIAKMRQTLDLDRLYGCAPRSYYMYRAPYPSPNSLYTLLSDEILPKMVKNKEREDKARLIYINTGSQRFDIFKGPFTYDTSFIVSPFTSAFRYIPDVPYSIASRLLTTFNTDKRPWLVKRGEEDERGWMIKDGLAPPEMQYIDTKKVDMEFAARPAQQIVLGGDERVIPGYTTFDDFGRDGDDTIHSRIPLHRVGNCVEARAGFPLAPNGDVEEEIKPEVVDVVFLDFIQEFVLVVLERLGANYTKEDTREYMDKEETLTKMMLDYASTYWSKDC